MNGQVKKNQYSTCLMKDYPSDDDLKNCLSKQPRKQPKPKRETTSLTFSPSRWQKTRSRWYTRPIPPLKWRWWLSGTLGGIVSVVINNQAIVPEVSLRSGPVSEDNLTNFPPPDPVGKIQSDGRAYVTVVNAVPGTMQIRLEGTEQNYSYRVPPCLECSHTNDTELLSQFCDRAPQTGFYLPPGNYEAFVSFGSRVKGFRSDWRLAKEWGYEMCIGGKFW